MQYIPESKLRENETEVLDILDTISRKHLNLDVKGIITKFHNPYMTPDDSNIDKFWWNLGHEVCNLKAWSWYCFDILQRRFGKSSKYCKYVNYEKDFYDLRNHLDKMLCNYYPHSQGMINDVNLIYIFYNNNTIMEYELGNVYKKRPITSADKNYILVFLNRLDECLDFIKDNLDKIGNKSKYCNATRKAVLKIINKMKTRLSKDNIINDIEVTY